jgi:hypothetical protein
MRLFPAQGTPRIRHHIDARDQRLHARNQRPILRPPRGVLRLIFDTEDAVFSRASVAP